jgi:hypothetical protein
MSLLEQRTNHALRALDDDLRTGRTSVEDYRAHRRHLFQRLRAGLETTRDITVRRPTPPTVAAPSDRGSASSAAGAMHPPGMRAGAVVVWTLLLILLAGCVVILLPIVRGP